MLGSSSTTILCQVNAYRRTFPAAWYWEAGQVDSAPAFSREDNKKKTASGDDIDLRVHRKANSQNRRSSENACLPRGRLAQRGGRLPGRIQASTASCRERRTRVEYVAWHHTAAVSLSQLGQEFEQQLCAVVMAAAPGLIRKAALLNAFDRGMALDSLGKTDALR
jgi:hypothetical protein